MLGECCGRAVEFQRTRFFTNELGMQYYNPWQLLKILGTINAKNQVNNSGHSMNSVRSQFSNLNQLFLAACGSSRIATSLLVGALIFCLTGCDNQSQQAAPQQQASQSTSYGTISWNTGGSDPAPGVEKAILVWHTQGNKLTYVVWTDFEDSLGKSSGSSATSDSDGHRHETDLETGAGKSLNIAFESVFNDGADPTDSLKIESQDFDLSSGRLLVVSSGSGEIEINQCELNPILVEILMDSELQRDSLKEKLQDLAKNSSELQGYFSKE